MDTQWFLTRDGETIAQFSTAQFKRAVVKGVIRPTDFVRRSDSSTFISAAQFLPASYHARSATGRIVAGVLAAVALLGGVGYGVMTLGPKYLTTAFASLEKLQTAAGADVRREALKYRLLTDEATQRFFQALAEKHPDTFETIVTQFAANADMGLDDAIAKARSYLMTQVIQPRSRFLDDEDKVALMTLSRDMTAHLATTNPKLCIAVALGKPFGDIRPFVTPDLTAREQDLLLKMLDASPQSADLLPAADAQALNNKIARQLYETHGEETALLDLENVPEGKDEPACRMFAAYLDGLLALPQDERVALVRVMMIDPERLTQTAPTAVAPAPADPFPQGASSTPQGTSSTTDANAQPQ